MEQYVKEGVLELDDGKLPALLNLKYHSISDAKKALGGIGMIRDTFIGFQGGLYGGGKNNEYEGKFSKKYQ